MFIKKALVCATFAAGIFGAVLIPVANVAAAEIWVQRAPPPARYEVVPRPRRGYLWAPGHWQWNASRNRHYWTAGTWERARSGYVFQNPQWVERDGRWFYQARRWDRDGDGIPNRRDSTPDGMNGARDSDRDGIPDRRDAQPNNPKRS